MRRAMELVVVGVAFGVFHLACSSGGGGGGAIPAAEADSPELLQRVADLENLTANLKSEGIQITSQNQVLIGRVTVAEGKVLALENSLTGLTGRLIAAESVLRFFGVEPPEEEGGNAVITIDGANVLLNASLLSSNVFTFGLGIINPNDNSVLCRVVDCGTP